MTSLLEDHQGNLWFGTQSGVSRWDGLIDEVAIFNRALTQTEVQAIYNAGSAGMTPPNSPPNVSAAAPSIASIWPPNNKMVDITVNGVTDPDGDAVSITIDSITNDETGAADAGGIGTATAQVRASRNGKGSGRTYTISFTAADGKGGNTSGSVQVVVAHDQGKRSSKPAAVESTSWGEIKRMER